MGYKLKYFKYKQKYLKLKNQIGGNFYFSVYVFSKTPLDDTRKSNMISLLKELYGGEINVVTNPDESLYSGLIWNDAVRYIDDKSNNVSYYKNLHCVTSFVIETIPDTLKGPMSDAKLTTVEHQVNDKLNKYDLNSLSVPDINAGLEKDFSRGWGFYSEGIALITLVEKQ